MVATAARKWAGGGWVTYILQADDDGFVSMPLGATSPNDPEKLPAVICYVTDNIAGSNTSWIQVADGNGASSGARCLVNRSTVFGWSAAVVGTAPQYWVAFVVGY